MCLRVVNGYLTESKLIQEIKVFCVCSGNKFIATQSRPLTNKRLAFDMEINIRKRKILIEFDGPQHYQNPFVIYRDVKKESEAKAIGFEIVRIPYWIQLNTLTFNYFFSLKQKKHKIDTLYPHGFIDSLAHLPSSYSTLGMQRFCFELRYLPKKIQIQVISSLYFQQSVRAIPLKYIYNPKCKNLKIISLDINKEVANLKNIIGSIL